MALIIEVKPDDWNIVTWHFELEIAPEGNKFQIVFDKYSYMKRESIRHRWVPYKTWSRRCRASTNIAKPELPMNITKRALDAAKNSVIIKVK